MPWPVIYLPMTDFVALDVETANCEPSSICALGAAKVRDGRVVDTFYSLVKPEPEYYHWSCTRVHGLTAADTEDAPCFDAVWTRFCKWAESLPLAAHNARFDESCIRAACRVYRLDAPDGGFMCTLSAARRKIPRGVLASKSLDSLCDFFAIDLKNHHNALADAVAAAKLGIILL